MKNKNFTNVLFGIFTIISLILPNFTFAAFDNVTVISKNFDGDLGDGDSDVAVISENGRFVVFQSDATNLVSGDNNNSTDVFIYDIENGDIELISKNSSGVIGNGDSGGPVISSGGRYVVFWSYATNFVDNDTNGQEDVFIYDINTGTIELASRTALGGVSDGSSVEPAISGDGRYVVFSSTATNLTSDTGISELNTFIYDNNTNTVELLSKNSDDVPGDATSETPIISPNGRYIAFTSQANNLADESVSSGFANIILYDRQLDVMIDISPNANEDLFMSDVNNYGDVVFSASASNLVTGDNNTFGDYYDVFFYDHSEDEISLVNVTALGEQPDQVYDEPIGMSSDGRFIGFLSESDIFDSNDTTDGFQDLFFKDMLTGEVKKESVLVDGTEANNTVYGYRQLISGNRYVALSTFADNLTNDDYGAGGINQIIYVELVDDDGIPAYEEDNAPNGGDVNENGYDDATEDGITSFFNNQSETYTTVEVNGNYRCNYISEVSSSSLDDLNAEDGEYEYPFGVTSFSLTCKETGQTATVTMFYFYGSLDIDTNNVVVRKYNNDTQQFSTINSATVENVTIDGDPAIKISYEVTDGGSLDEDGLDNGTIVDPVGVGVPATSNSPSSGRRSSGSYAGFNSNNIAANSSPAINPSCVSNLSTNMKQGSRYGEVKSLQEILNILGFNSGLPDGLFGPLTSKAVRAFQVSKNLVSDGIVGPKTRDAIKIDCGNPRLI